MTKVYRENKTLEIVTITRSDSVGLKKTINSTKLLRDKYGVKQIIVDSSIGTDKENNLDFISKQQGISYYWQKPSGIAAAYNFGISKSRAKWIWFLNSGDITHKLLDEEYLLKTLELSTSDVIIFRIEMGEKITNFPPLYSLWPPIKNWLPHPGSIFRSKKLKECGEFDNKYKIAGDYDMWLRLFENGSNIDCVPLVVLKYDLGGSSSNQKKVSKEAVRIIVSHALRIFKIYVMNLIQNVIYFAAYLKEAIL